MSAKSDAELMKIVDDAWNEAWDICHSTDGWKEEKKADNGDIVMSKKNKRGKKVYRIVLVIDCPPEKLIKGLESCKDLTSWNNTLTKHEILKEFPNNVRISYQITTEAAGGMVSARDFIFIYKNDRRNNVWMEGGCSVDYPGPKDKKIVRAWNYPGGQFVRPTSDPNKCEFVWVMDCEYRGWMPGSILELAMPQAQLAFAECIRKFAATL